MAESEDSNATSSNLIISPQIDVSSLPQSHGTSVKLTEGNFLIWRQQIVATIEGCGLESYLTGDQEIPPKMVAVAGSDQMKVNPDFLAWHRQDRRLAGWIQSTLSESTMVLIVGLTSTKDIWKALEVHFASQSKAKMMQYRLQIQTMKKNAQSMTEYLSKMKTCCDLLGSAGCRVTDDEQILHILAGLGPEYDSVMVMVTSRDDFAWTVPDVAALLLSFETRLEAAKQSAVSLEGSQPSLNIAFQSQPKREGFSQQSRGGYVARNDGRGGMRSGRGGRGGRNFGNKIICQLCQKPGHGADRCWHRFEHNFAPAPPQNQMHRPQQGNPSANVAQARGPSFQPALSVASPSDYNFDGSTVTPWYPDSGATNHVTNDLNNLNISAEYNGGKQLHLGNGLGVKIAHIGQSHILPNASCSSKSLLLKNLLHVPAITKNLMSVSQFAKDNNVFFEFHPALCFVKNQVTKEVVLKGTLEQGLYQFFIPSPSANTASNSNKEKLTPHPSNKTCSPPLVCSVSMQSHLVSKSSSLALWHQRLGHSSLDAVKLSLRSCNIPFQSMNEADLCHSCCVSKSHRLPYSPSDSVLSAPLQVIHSDLWGPSPITSRNGYHYYVSFIDEYSRFTWIYLLKHKSDLYSAFKHFKAFVETQFSCSIKRVQSDWGGEYQGLTSFLKDSGILHTLSCPYTPQQNGLAERKHRHIVEMGLSLLNQAGLPHRFWDDAFVTATYLINLVPSRIIHHVSPFEKLFNSKPNYHGLKVFGCLCYPFLRPYNKHKLQERSAAATFLGYSPFHKGYKALLPSGKVIITRDILFDEAVFPFQSKTMSSSSVINQPNPLTWTSPSPPSQSFPLEKSSSNTHPDPTSSPLQISSPLISQSSPPVSAPSETNPPLSENTSSSSQNTSETAPAHSENAPIPSQNTSETAPAHSENTSETAPAHSENVPPPSQNTSQPATTRTHHMLTHSKAGIFKPKAFAAILPVSLPSSVLAALLIPVWKQAMLEEFLALLKNKTWVLTVLPPGKNLIGCTWIFKIKQHIDGCIARYKARLVAQGFSQQPGFDFNETFSPVVKPTTIRLILSIAVSRGWSVTHLDVNNAFLHGDLKEEIYMRQPVGFEQGSPLLVCKLNKAIYGLKQASRAWFYTVHSVLLSLGFTQSKADASLFFRCKDTEVVYILIYVDDMLLTGNVPSSLRLVIDQLSHHFSLKDLGEVNHFLGVEVARTSHGLHLNQATYIKYLLKKVKMEDAKGCPTPMVSSCELSKNVGAPTIDGKLYRSTVGALQYATITRPDISFAVNKVSQYMASPLDSHWKAVKRILRYLAGTTDYGIHIKRTDGGITAFSDSDWAADVDDRRSTSGYCTYFGGNLISWCAKKQSVVSRSSTEAEYRSLAHAASEVSWMNSLLTELKIKPRHSAVIWVDNLSAIALASNPVLHARTKHIELDVHFVRDKVIGKELELRHVPTIDQVADILTKPLGGQFFARLRNKLGVISRSTLELRGRVNESVVEPLDTKI